jgi:purine-binding chemotaxis protein CheW
MSTTAPASITEKFVLFELVSTTYGIRSSVVSRLEMVENVTPVPNATNSLEGVVLSRGRIIPAINLRARFGFPKIPYDLRTRLIVVEEGGRTVGLIVDTAREFTNLPSAEIKPAPDAIANLKGDYLEGIATINGRVILILRVSEVLKGSEVEHDQGRED